MSMTGIPPGTTAAPVTVRSPAAAATLPAAGSARTLAAAAAGTLLVTAVFSAVVTTVADSARSLHAGVAGETWALSGMSLGLATALLTAGALADALGRRRVLLCGAGLLAAASALGALAPTPFNIVYEVRPYTPACGGTPRQPSWIVSPNGCRGWASHSDRERQGIPAPGVLPAA
jgi:MFS family permease